jgi:hypothetical protein
MAALPLLAAAPALAQDPSLEEGDLDTGAPPPDDGYLADPSDPNASGDNVTLSEGDLDTSVPPPDDSYLDDPAPGEAAGDGSSDSGSPKAARRTPGVELGAALPALAAVALGFARRGR